MGRCQSFHLETLEHRDLLAVDVLSLIETDGDPRFVPRDLFEYNGSVYMRLSDNFTGPEPWVTEGTAESTQQLRDIRVGNFGSGARDFAEFNGKLYFTANNGFSGLELWVTEGSKASTRMIADIWPGSENGAPTELTEFQGSLYFFANDGESGRELYRTDGTAIGTQRVGDSIPGNSGSSGADLMVVGDQMFFRSESTADGQAGLWVSDGTDAGTMRLAIPGVESSDIQLMTEHRGQLVFVSNQQLWVSDGTLEGSRAIAPTGDTLGADFAASVSSNDVLYVVDELGLHELSNDLSTARTVTSLADGVAVSGVNTYFWNSSGVFVFSGSTAPQSLQAFNPQLGTRLVAHDEVPGGLLFSVNRALDRWEIWVTDGTLAGTQLLERVRDNSAEPFLEFQQFGEHIYFTATNGNFHESVWTIPAPVLGVPGVPGDLNDDQVVDAADIDLLYAALAAGSSDDQLDLNADNVVDVQDADFLIQSLLDTRRGDLNLDGQVNFADFLQLSAGFGKSEAGWSEGDLDGDLSVGFADFLLLSSNFGFSSDEG